MKSGPLSSGLNRREFLRRTAITGLVASGGACSANILIETPDITDLDALSNAQDKSFAFNSFQVDILDAVQMHLFPDDGDGPSARDLNGIAYLTWALNDPENIDDGDQVFIAKGILWLDDLAKDRQNEPFLNLNTDQQGVLISEISRSSSGENWLSLLMYYLTEALLLDPIYGGNPNMIGWQWLEHLPGFPRPIEGKTFSAFGENIESGNKS